MKRKTISFKYGKTTYKAVVIKKQRKTLAISVLPNNEIEVSAPLKVDNQKIKERLLKRARWISKQIQYFKQFQPRTPNPKYIGGETHLYLGKQYQLKIQNGKVSGVKLKGRYFVMTLSKNTKITPKQIMQKWYRDKAEIKFNQRFNICMKKFKNTKKPNLVIRELKSRWGSMSKNQRLTLNANLIKAPTECIDYVIVHELCHIKYPNHGQKFFGLLTEKMKDWEKTKHKLEIRLS